MTVSLEDTISVPITIDAAEGIDLRGLQWTLNFDADKLEYVGLEDLNGDLLTGVNMGNFGFNYIADGHITFAWFLSQTEAGQAVNLPDYSTLYRLKFKVKKAFKQL